MKLLWFSLTMTLVAQMASAQISENLQRRIVSQGVPAKALKDVSKFLYENKNRSFQQSTYSCEGKPETYLRPCIESKRIATQKTVTVQNPRNIAIIDFKKPSSQRRFYLIDLRSGEVTSYYTSHGIGTGRGDMATKFSNRKDSRMTSLGMYLTGDIYNGGYGMTLRMYGLEKSNDRAYDRDIVLHGAWYVSEDFMKMVNPKTKEAYKRIGVSWGCPAVSTAIAKKIIPILKQGSLIYHYHEDLMESARTGREVAVKVISESKKQSPAKPAAQSKKTEPQNKEKQTAQEVKPAPEVKPSSKEVKPIASPKVIEVAPSEVLEDEAEDQDGPQIANPHDGGEMEELQELQELGLQSSY